LALCLTTSAQGADKDLPWLQTDLGKKLDATVDRVGKGRFWGAVLVARKGEVLLAKGYGMADYAARPNDVRTLFEIASTSKQFTAAAILKLEMERRLKLTDTLGRFFKGVPQDKKEITVHHLLTHTSGIDQSTGLPYASPKTRKEFVEHIMAADMVSKPGEKFAYFNSGYALLAAIVERASGKSFEAYSRAKLFKPAKLKDTGFVKDKRLDKKRASTRICNWYPNATAVNWCWSWGYRGMGGVVSTVYDMLRWDRALRADKVLNEAAKKKYYTPALGGYALGWKVDLTVRGTTRVEHSGKVAGYAINYVRFLDDDAVVVVLSNGKTDVLGLANELAALLFEEVSFRASFDLRPYSLVGSQVQEFGAAASWMVKKLKGGRVALILVDRGKNHMAATIELPKGLARAVAYRIGLIIGPAPKAPEEKGIEAGVYLNRYQLDGGRTSVTEAFDMLVRPANKKDVRDKHGRPVPDGRVEIILQQADPIYWPVMCKMQPATARKLRKALRKAVGEK
jgi:CubicO group peptidase (beta-lactamase class C family)